MNIEICKKCTGCKDLNVSFFHYYTCPTVNVNINVLSDDSVRLYRVICSFDVHDIPRIERFKDIDPEKRIKPTCKYLIEHFLEYES